MPAVLQLQKQIRPYRLFESGAHQSERQFMDFVVNGVSLWKRCADEGLDNISCIWLPHTDKSAVRRLLLQDPPDFPDHRCSLYVCAECGHISCGAVSVHVRQTENYIIWEGFAYQNNYEPAYPLDSFASLEPVTFDLTEYQALLQPFLE